MATYRIVRQNDGFYVEVKGILWGWNREREEIGWGCDQQKRFGTQEAAEAYIDELLKPTTFTVVKQIEK